MVLRVFCHSKFYTIVYPAIFLFLYLNFTKKVFIYLHFIKARATPLKKSNFTGEKTLKMRILRGKKYLFYALLFISSII